MPTFELSDLASSTLGADDVTCYAAPDSTGDVRVMFVFTRSDGETVGAFAVPVAAADSLTGGSLTTALAIAKGTADHTPDFEG